MAYITKEGYLKFANSEQLDKWVDDFYYYAEHNYRIGKRYYKRPKDAKERAIRTLKLIEV